MSGTGKRGADKLNIIGVVTVGICGAVLTYVSIILLEAFYMNETNGIDQQRAIEAPGSLRRTTKDLALTHLDGSEGSTIPIDKAIDLIVRDVGKDPSNLVPAVAPSTTPTTEAIYEHNPPDVSAPAAAAGSGSGSGSAAGSGSGSGSEAGAGAGSGSGSASGSAAAPAPAAGTAPASGAGAASGSAAGSAAPTDTGTATGSGSASATGSGSGSGSASAAPAKKPAPVKKPAPATTGTKPAAKPPAKPAGGNGGNGP